MINLDKYLKCKKEATEVLAKAHNRVFNVLQASVDELSASIFKYIKPELQILKKKFPDYRIVFMPLTHTQGDNVGPAYGATIETQWIIFAVAKDENHVLTDRERIYSIPEIYSNIDAISEFFVWENALLHKISPFDINVSSWEYPPLNHVEVILRHNRFS